MISQLLNACFGLLLPEIIVCALCYERLLPPSFLPLALNRCGSVFPLDSLRNLALREMSISQQPNKWRQESVGCLHFQDWLFQLQKPDARVFPKKALRELDLSGLSGNCGN